MQIQTDLGRRARYGLVAILSLKRISPALLSVLSRPRLVLLVFALALRGICLLLRFCLLYPLLVPCTDDSHAEVPVELLGRIKERRVVVREEDGRARLGVFPVCRGHSARKAHDVGRAAG